MSIQNDVERGLSIRKELECLKTELDEIEGRLKAAGIAAPEEQVELNDEEREGRQFLAHGAKHVVPVVFTADLLIKSFRHLSPLHSSLRTALGGVAPKLTEFFETPNKWESNFDSGKRFRRRAAEVLGKAAPMFITACVARDKDGIPKSAIKVEWDRVADAKQP